MKSTLYYVLDPMCCWCWGFRPVFTELLKLLPKQVEVKYIMGGLAADSDQPMPPETQAYIQEQWRLVTEKTGAEFNWDYWTICQPRRSTYPACRAVIAAGLQGNENIPKMILAIQTAYYLQAQNPSDLETHVLLAKELGLDITQFKQDLTTPEVEDLLQKDFKNRRRLAVSSFPTVLLESTDGLHFIAQGDDSLENIKKRMQACSLLNEL